MKRLLIPIVPLAFLAILFFYPLASITARGLAPQGMINLSAFGKIIRSEFYRETLWFTFWQAAVSTVRPLLAVFHPPAGATGLALPTSFLAGAQSLIYGYLSKTGIPALCG
jgi:ABC-type spermidine/putrescine transport system permease subunit I